MPPTDPNLHNPRPPNCQQKGSDGNLYDCVPILDRSNIIVVDAANGKQQYKPFIDKGVSRVDYVVYFIIIFAIVVIILKYYCRYYQNKIKEKELQREDEYRQRITKESIVSDVSDVFEHRPLGR